MDKERIANAKNTLEKCLEAVNRIENGEPEKRVLQELNINQNEFRRILWDKKLSIDNYEGDGIPSYYIPILTPEEKLFCEIFSITRVEVEGEFYAIMDRNSEMFPSDLKETFPIVLSTLAEREQMVIKEKYYEDKTFEEIAKPYHVTRERIRQIESKALRKLRHPSRKNILLNGKAVYDAEMELRELHSQNELRIIELKKEEEKRIREELIKMRSEGGFENSPYADHPSPSDLMDVDICELELSVRSYNVLRRAGINTIGEITNLSYADLSRLRNMGRKSADEIATKLKELGLELRRSEVDD